VPFWEPCGLRILNFWLGRKASCSQLLGRHRSGSAFNSGHLINSSTIEKLKMVFVNEIHETKSVNVNVEK
jgi:hypothetical protein